MSKRKLTLEEWLDDLCVRFIINLPEDDLRSIHRICFAVEEAQWFYEDFIRPLDPSLPSLPLRNFCLRMFSHCPLLSPFSEGHHMAAFDEFLAYKTRIPVRGAIMLNDAMDSVVLVKGWKGSSWGFPRGKIAFDEDDLTCAIREVYEETGLDLAAANLVPADKNAKYIDVNMKGNQLRLFVFRNVPMDTYFEPRTRKEISKVQWWPLSELPAFRKKGQQQQQYGTGHHVNPNNFYVVAPFLAPLRKWVIEQKKRDAKLVSSNHHLDSHHAPRMGQDDFLTEDDRGAESATKDTSYKPSSARGLDTAEGATAALSRLLKIQPPTEGLQSEAASQPAAPQSSSAALFALLHSNPTLAPSNISLNAPPRTPLDHPDRQPSMPNTPHHQAPRPPPYSSMPPPPAFPIHQQERPFSYREQNSHNGQPFTPLAELQQHNNGNDRNYHGNEHRPYQPQHLIHPQPLPPHVQRTVFTGGPVHASLVSQPAQQYPPPHLPSNASINANGPQFPVLHAPMGPPKIDSTKSLPSHSLALLSAFKSRDQTSETNSNSLSLRRFEEAPVPPRSQPQELPAVETQRATPMVPPPPVAIHPKINVLEPGALTPRQPISASQKSTLLGMFKNPTVQTVLPLAAAAATALPTSGIPSAVELSAVEPLSTNASTTSALLNDKRTPDHLASSGDIPILQPESNLPFHAMKILSRPQQEKEINAAPPDVSSDSTTQSKSKGKKKAPRENGRRQAALPPAKPFQPQILKRPGTLKGPQSPSTILSTPGSRQTQTMSNRRPGQSTDITQSLLSLFGKPQPSMTSPIPKSPTLVNPFDPTLNIPPRSRVGSLVSGEGAASRRGSQAPISLADRGFLLNYLDENVAKGSRH